MSRLAERIAQTKRDRDFVSLAAELPPYTRWMGITFVEVGGEMFGKMAYADHLVGNPSLPALHGGATGALLESTALFQVMWDGNGAVLPKTISITIDYLRPGRPVGTIAYARVVRQGRRVTTAHVSAWQEERAKPVATATAHFLLPLTDD